MHTHVGVHTDVCCSQLDSKPDGLIVDSIDDVGCPGLDVCHGGHMLVVVYSGHIVLSNCIIVVVLSDVNL